MKKTVTTVVPVYNEEAVLPAFFSRMAEVMDRLGEKYSCKVILINDGSRDSSWELIKKQSEQDERFSGICLSRNFGHQAALSCGYAWAPGDAVVCIDSDLQDPPEIICDMVKEWEKGAKVVLAVRKKRDGETLTKLWTAKLFYKIMSSLSETESQEASGDFRLLDRVAVDALNRLSETHRYVRGLVGWLGFSRSIVEYDRAARHAGQTKYPMIKMIRLATDAIISMSFWPLRAAYITALVLTVPFLLYLIYNFFAYIVFQHAMVPGWSSLILAVILFGAFNLLMLGILGEYTGRIYSEVKNRPIFLVEECCGSAVKQK